MEQVPREQRAVALPASNESQRLQALTKIQILDSLSEQAYDDLVTLASQICGTPIALISMVDRDRQWFKAKVGLQTSETHRDLSFCAHAILAPDDVFSIHDTQRDARFVDSPLVTRRGQCPLLRGRFDRHRRWRSAGHGLRHRYQTADARRRAEALPADPRPSGGRLAQDAPGGRGSHAPGAAPGDPDRRGPPQARARDRTARPRAAGRRPGDVGPARDERSVDHQQAAARDARHPAGRGDRGARQLARPDLSRRRARGGRRAEETPRERLVALRMHAAHAPPRRALGLAAVPRRGRPQDRGRSADPHRRHAPGHRRAAGDAAPARRARPHGRLHRPRQPPALRGTRDRRHGAGTPLRARGRHRRALCRRRIRHRAGRPGGRRAGPQGRRDPDRHAVAVRRGGRRSHGVGQHRHHALRRACRFGRKGTRAGRSGAAESQGLGPRPGLHGRTLRVRRPSSRRFRPRAAGLRTRCRPAPSRWPCTCPSPGTRTLRASRAC